MILNRKNVKTNNSFNNATLNSVGYVDIGYDVPYIELKIGLLDIGYTVLGTGFLVYYTL